MRVVVEWDGRYVIVFDSDDTRERRACEGAALAIKDTGADIVQFGTSCQ